MQGQGSRLSWYKMASRLRLFGNQLKSFWEEQPVVVISVILGLSGNLINLIYAYLTLHYILLQLLQ